MGDRRGDGVGRGDCAVRWAVLVGGTGTNLRAILDSGLDVALVVSHRDRVGALDIARAHGVPTRVLLARDFPDRIAYDQALVDTLHEAGIEWVAMAGFLRWLQESTIRAFPGRILNLHPSLLPAYPGLHAIERAFADRVPWTGVTVHFVDEGHDTGPIAAQGVVPRHPEDDLARLEARIHQMEHQLYPRVLSAVDRGQVWLDNDTVNYAEEGDKSWIHGHC